MTLLMHFIFVVLFVTLFASCASSAAWMMMAPTFVMTTPLQQRQLQHAAMTVMCGWTLTITTASAAGNIDKGRVLFDNNCAACHVGGQNLINPPRTLHKDALEKNLGSLDVTAVQTFVQNSVVHRGAFILGSKLSNKDFENVVSYVVDQASNDKWDGE